MKKLKKKLKKALNNSDNNPEFYEICKKEYKDLQDKILLSLQTENAIVVDELQWIKEEMEQMKLLKVENWEENYDNIQIKATKKLSKIKEKVNISEKIIENVKWNSLEKKIFNFI